MSKSILFLAHVSEAGNTLPKISYEVLGAALKLAKQLGGHLTIEFLRSLDLTLLPPSDAPEARRKPRISVSA